MNPKLTPFTPIRLMLCIPVLMCLLTSVQAQTPTPTPLSEEQQELQRRRDLLNLQKEIAESEQAIAEAEKAKREAKFPSPSSSPLAGTTTINEGAVIEAQMVAYVSMARAANKIVSAIRASGTINNLAIFNEADVKLLLSYKVARNQLETLRLRYEELLATEVVKHCQPKPSPAPSPQPDVAVASVTAGMAIARSFLGSFVDLTALLRTNVDIKGQSFDIAEAPLVSEVFRAFRCQSGNTVKLYYPAVFPPDIDAAKKYEILGILEQLHCLRVSAGKLTSDIEKNDKNLSESEEKIKAIIAALEEADAARIEIERKMRNLLKGYCRRFPSDAPLVEGLNNNLRRFCPNLLAEQRVDIFELRDRLVDILDQISALKMKLETEKGKYAAFKQIQGALWRRLQEDLQVASTESAAEIAAQLKALNEQFDRMIASFVQVETATNVNQLTMFIKAENLKTALPEGNAKWLQLKVIKAGGNNRIKTNLVWDIFTGGNRLSHSGGAIVQYILFDATGQSIASDTITEYTNYIKAHKVRDLSDYTVDNPGCPCATKPETCPQRSENK